MMMSPRPLSILSRRVLARISMAVMLGVSSINIGTSLSMPAASVAFCQSSWLMNPVFKRLESMRASEVSKRMDSCSLDISRENTATGTRSSTATLRARFRAKAVFPILGRAARIMRSDFCRPEVSWSRRGYPVLSPESPPLEPWRSSSMSMLRLIRSPRLAKFLLDLDSEMLKMAFSAKSMISTTSPRSFMHRSTMAVALFIRVRREALPWMIRA